MTVPLRDRSVAQSQLAEARATIEAGRASVMSALENVWAWALDGYKATGDHKISLQLASTYGTQAAATAVDLIHAAVGTSGIRKTKAFERHFRDVHTLTQLRTRKDASGHCQVEEKRACPSLDGSASIIAQQAHVTSSQTRNERVLSERW